MRALVRAQVRLGEPPGPAPYGENGMPKNPADMVCPALWRARKAARRAARRSSAPETKEKFRELTRRHDELGTLAGCRYARPTEIPTEEVRT